jgi:hypothetical protein
MTTRRALRALVVAVCAVVWQGCGSGDGSGVAGAPAVTLPATTLALVVNPKSGAVLAETGAGIYVLPAGKQTAARRLRAVLVRGEQRVAISKTLTLAYTDDGGIVGSSHPDRADTGDPANLGLLVSRDGAATWRIISLYGTADLHILRTAAASLYAVDFARSPLKLMITSDYGRTWTTRQAPGPITDMAVDPTDPTHAFAITGNGLLVTHDEGSSWRPEGDEPRALAWTTGGPLYLGDADGSIRASAGGDSTPALRGNLGTGVVALTGGPRGALWAIGDDRTVRVSTDGGRRWSVRYRLRERGG